MAWNGSGPASAPAKPQRKKAHVPAAAWLVAGVVAAVMAVGWIVTAGRDADATEEESSAASNRKIRKNAGRYAVSPEEAVRRALSPEAVAKARKPRKRAAIDILGNLQGADRKLAEAVQAALDADDFKKALPAANAALKSDNPEVRQNAVEALGWFGLPALPELTACMADPDDDVRQSAAHQWEMAVQEIDVPAQQFAVVAAAFATVSDEDQLVSLGGLLNGAATDMIDNEDDEAVAKESRVEVLQTLVDIIDSGREKNMAAAKEAYKDITGNEWMGIDEAERYLADPDNYDPDAPADAGNVPDGNNADWTVMPPAGGNGGTDYQER